MCVCVCARAPRQGAARKQALQLEKTEGSVATNKGGRAAKGRQSGVQAREVREYYALAWRPGGLARLGAAVR